MKTMEELIADEVQKLEVKREDLEELNLDSRCRAKSVVGLDGLKALKVLSLCNVGLTTLDGFPPLANLKELHLADNKISGGLGILTSLVSLEKLNLVHNSISTMEELTPLSKLDIKRLDMLACPVEVTESFREEVFKTIPSLEVLDNVDRTGQEISDSDDESYVESEEEEASEGSDQSHADEDESGDGEGDGDEKEGCDEEGASDDGGEGEEEEVQKIDLSVLVEGPPVEDSDRDVDYQEEDPPSSEDVNDEDDADLDDIDSEAVGYPTGTRTSEGVKKRKREEDDDGDDDL